MKVFVYVPCIAYLGEQCRLLIVFDRIYIALSRERKRFNFDITL